MAADPATPALPVAPGVVAARTGTPSGPVRAAESTAPGERLTGHGESAATPGAGLGQDGGASVGDPRGGAGGADSWELFGPSGLSWAGGWVRHEMAYLKAGVWQIARQVPAAIAMVAAAAWRADAGAFLVVVAAQVVMGAGTALGLLATNQVLVALLGGGPVAVALKGAWPALAMLAAAVGAASVAGAASTWASGRLEPRIERAAMLRLHSLAIQVRLQVLEDATYQHTLKSGAYGADALRRMLGYAITVARTLIALAAAGSVLAILHPALLPLLLGVVVPKGWASIRSARRRYASFQRWVEHARKEDQLERLLIDPASGPELRVHGAGPYLLDRYAGMSLASQTEQARLAKAEAATTIAGDAASGTAALATYTALAALLAYGHLPLAVAGTALLAIRTATGHLEAVIEATNRLYEQHLFAADLHTAITSASTHLTPSGTTPVAGPPKLIDAQGLSFTYPGARAPALHDVSLSIKAGQVIALVGENGSGKTTLARLLAALYEADTGSITWDGIELTDLERAGVWEHLAVVDQTYPRWPFTAATNITIGRPTRPRDPRALEAAARTSGADQLIEGLAHSWDTLLARGYVGGADLSGGQWQRIALARATWRDAAIVIYDEPTAALDPAAEIAVFDQLRAQAAAGQTIILITHRLASTASADHIYRLQNGRIAEHGTHTQLLAAGGEYARLYALQAAQFQQT